MFLHIYKIHSSPDIDPVDNGGSCAYDVCACVPQKRTFSVSSSLSSNSSSPLFFRAEYLVCRKDTTGFLLVADGLPPLELLLLLLLERLPLSPRDEEEEEEEEEEDEEDVREARVFFIISGRDE